MDPCFLTITWLPPGFEIDLNRFLSLYMVIYLQFWKPFLGMARHAWPQLPKLAWSSYEINIHEAAYKESTLYLQ